MNATFVIVCTLLKYVGMFYFGMFLTFMNYALYKGHKVLITVLQRCGKLWNIMECAGVF